MGEDAAGTLRDLISRRQTIDKVIADHRGRIANTAGDSLLVEFASALDAVECAAVGAASPAVKTPSASR